MNVRRNKRTEWGVTHLFCTHKWEVRRRKTSKDPVEEGDRGGRGTVNEFGGFVPVKGKFDFKALWVMMFHQQTREREEARDGGRSSTNSFLFIVIGGCKFYSIEDTHSFCL